MSTGFKCYFSKWGDLLVNDGVVVAKRTGVRFPVGTGGASVVPVERRNGEHTAVRAKDGMTFVGGSGRNLISSVGTALTSGSAGPVGWFTPTVPDAYQSGIFSLVVTGPSAAEISDGSDVVAILSTGGTAPVGNYVATTYGRATYNATTAFTLALAEEEGAPGAIPDAVVQVSAGTAQGGRYAATDAANYTSVVDPDWTLFIDPSGSAELRYLGTAVATRADGVGHDPDGRFLAEETAFFYNPTPALEDDFPGTDAVNPFGVLTLVFSWPATPDLDTTTRFLSDEVGYPVDSSESAAIYTTFSGDDTGPSGSETVVIDLAQAWLDGAISSVAEVLCHADWYPGAGGSGLATLAVDYTVGAYSTSLSIAPGGATPASSRVASLRILADGSVGNATAAWQAHVEVRGRLPRAGVVYLELVEVSGVLDAVNGPYFATALPTNFNETFYFPLAICDGDTLEEIHTGALAW